MNRRAALLPVVAGLVMACGQAPATPPASFPDTPIAQPGWMALGTVKSSRGEGFVGMHVLASGRALALSVVCVGTGSLVVSYGPGEATPPFPNGGLDALVFPCAADAGATSRSELGMGLGSGQVTFSGGIVPGMGSIGQSSFAVSVEEARP